MSNGTVSALYRYPVKSMAGESLTTLELGPRGVPGDRAWAVRDEERGGIRGGKRFPELMQCSARYTETPPLEGSIPAEITLPDGSLLAISSGHSGLASGSNGCLEDGYEWTSRFDRDFLQAGAELMLAAAPTTPGIDSAVTIEWHPDETRVRTTLEFAGPLDIPNGTCWVDDALEVQSGVVRASAEQGVKTSPFAGSACGRFFDHLPNGGAGEQAVTLLPAIIELPGGGQLRFVAEDVSVREDAIVVMGSLVRD